MKSQNKTRMQREIRFRAWDEENKLMYTNEGFHRKKLFISLEEGNLIVGYYDKNEDWFELKLLQFTGLKDKNGEDIFEGDVVKVIHHTQRKLPKINCFIEYLDFNTSYYVSNRFAGQGMDEGYCQFLWMCEVEVIGNIYENPELLNALNQD